MWSSKRTWLRFLEDSAATRPPPPHASLESSGTQELKIETVRASTLSSPPLHNNANFPVTPDIYERRWRAGGKAEAPTPPPATPSAADALAGFAGTPKALIGRLDHVTTPRTPRRSQGVLSAPNIKIQHKRSKFNGRVIDKAGRSRVCRNLLPELSPIRERPSAALTEAQAMAVESFLGSMERSFAA